MRKIISWRNKKTLQRRNKKLVAWTKATCFFMDNDGLTHFFTHF